MTVAVPKFEDTVAPCFEVARLFLFARVEDGRIVDRQTVECEGEGLGHMRLLRERHACAVICGGIKNFYRDSMEAAGIAVFSNVCGSVEEALRRFLAGELKAGTPTAETIEEQSWIPREDLICWTTDLFLASGYEVLPGDDTVPLPIDLIAKYICPVCARPVLVAICCGAHTYRSDQEIKQLYQVARTDYHARVYVHPSSQPVMQICKEYDVELIDPNE